MPKVCPYFSKLGAGQWNMLTKKTYKHRLQLLWHLTTIVPSPYHLRRHLMNKNKKKKNMTKQEQETNIHLSNITLTNINLFETRYPEVVGILGKKSYLHLLLSDKL